MIAKALRVFDRPEYHWQLVEISEPEILEGEVLLESLYSSINYKDALAVSGKGKILRSFPLIPGIDVCGRILKSKSNQFSEGDIVFQTGQNLGETYDGGYSSFVKVSEKNILKLPEQLSPEQVMTLGTAGFTAALAIYKMELNELPKDKPILVSGASGGVGSFAVQMLTQKGYEVEAVTGKLQAHELLKKMGAKKVLTPEHVLEKVRPLESVRWGGCIDNVGGEFLSAVLSQIQLHGSVASIGLAGGHKITSTVMPFILRGVNLLGVSSNNCPWSHRENVWQDIANLADVLDFQTHTRTISLEDVPQICEELLSRKIIGRVLVKFQ